VLSYAGSLIFKMQDPTAVLASLPVSQTMLKGEPVLVCKHSWGNIAKLRKLGLRAPSLFKDAEWKYTGRFTPMAHQRKSVAFLLEHDKAFVLNDLGTGKTGACLWAMEYLMQQGVLTRILITCPLSVLGVWSDELFNIMPHRTSVVLYGSRAKRLELLKENTQICVINHDGITTIEKELEAQKFDLIIADEASTYRNAGTKRYKLFRQLAKSVQRLWLLTGTPAPNAPTDVWALIKLVNPASFMASFGAFKEITMRKISQFIWVPRHDSTETIYKLMKPAIRFRKEECLDLPPLTYVNRECIMSAEQIKAFEAMRKHMAMEKGASGQKITAANAAVLLIKLMQICCGAVKDNDGEAHFLDDSARLSLLKEVIEEAGNKAIVFIPFKAVMRRVKEFLDAAKIGCEVVNGDVSQSTREAIFNQFQRGSLPVLLAHPKTAAHGLTLTASSCIIWYGPIFSAENWAQANARIHRAGQTNACTIIRIGASKIEWKLYEALNSKVRMQDVILRAYEELTA
jgi:SNF2 family DNA or RNA helicase